MRNAALRRVILSSKYRSSEARQFLARVPPMMRRDEDAYATLIDGLVADAVWPKLDGLWILAAPNSAAELTNLKSGSYGLSVIGTPTFAAYRGYTGNASDSSLNTGYTPGSGALVSNDNHIGVYCLTSRTTGQAYIQMGANHDPSGDGLHIFPKHTDNNTYYANQAVDNAHALSANASGHYINTRTTSTLVTLYRNGASFNTDVNTATGNLPNRSIYIGSLNIGSLLFPTGDELSAAHLGAGLSSTLAAALSARINAYMTTYGVNTY